jgi:hypothetical protein
VLQEPHSVALTAPERSSLTSLSACLALAAARVAVGVGVEVKTEQGTVVRGRLGERPFVLAMRDEEIAPNWRVARSRGAGFGGFVPLEKAVVRDGLTAIRFHRAGTFLVIAPRSATAPAPPAGCPA